MRITGLDHVVIRACDLQAMVRFYSDVLGCVVEKRNEQLGLVHLRAGASLIDLVDVNGELGRMGGTAPSAQGRNLDHFCLRLDSFDIDDIRSQLGRFGIDPGKVHQNFGAEGTGPSVYLSDPEGNVIELKGPATHQGQ